MEQWHRKWLLVLDTTYRDSLGGENVGVQYLMENLPKSKNGHVLVVCKPGSSTHEYGANMAGPVVMKGREREWKHFRFQVFTGSILVETD